MSVQYNMLFNLQHYNRAAPAAPATEVGKRIIYVMYVCITYILMYCAYLLQP